MVYELLKSNICGKNATQTIKIVSNIEKISQKAIQSQEKEGGWETHFPAKLSFVGKIGEVVTYCRLLGEEKAFFSVNLGGLMASWRGGAEGEGEGEFVMKSVEVGEIDSFSSSASFSCLSSSEEFASSPLSGSPPPSSSSLKLFSSIGGSEVNLFLIFSSFFFLLFSHFSLFYLSLAPSTFDDNENITSIW